MAKGDALGQVCAHGALRILTDTLCPNGIDRRRRSLGWLVHGWMVGDRAVALNRVLPTPETRSDLRATLASVRWATFAEVGADEEPAPEIWKLVEW